MPPAPRPPRLSRRHFLAVAPTALAIEAGAAPTGSLPERARAWNGTRELVRGLLLRWQDLEKEIQRRTGSLKLRKAARDSDADALEMIAIDKRLPALFDTQAAGAAQMAALPCQSVADALVKLQVAIAMVGPEDTDPTVWALLQDGYEHLVRSLGAPEASRHG
jgi:hypothetical protein